MSAIHFIVTAGGTREPIDDVRYIGNVSSGRLGGCIARTAAERGHSVTLIRARGSFFPSMPRPAPGPDEERPKLLEFTTARDLGALLEREVRSLPEPGVVVMAAAVADYTPIPRKGKIPSESRQLVIRLERAEKIVDRIKAWNKKALLVKFKLESGRTPEELLEIGLKSASRSRADLMVLNDISGIRDGRHPAIVLRPDRELHREVEGKESIARVLVAAVEELVRDVRGGT